MPRVRVEPLGIEVEAPHGETVMDAVNAEGYFWPIGCDKIGECTNCAMEVISGVGRLSAMGRYERENLIRQRGVRSIEDPRLAARLSGAHRGGCGGAEARRPADVALGGPAFAYTVTRAAMASGSGTGSPLSRSSSRW